MKEVLRDPLMGLPAPKKRYQRLRLVLTEARDGAGLTQVELGNRLGRPQTFVSKIERGLRSVDVIEFIEIAKALGVDPKTLIGRLEQEE